MFVVSLFFFFFFFFFFLRASTVSYVVFVLTLFFSHLSFFWCLGKAVFQDVDITWVSSIKVLFKFYKYGKVERYPNNMVYQQARVKISIIVRRYHFRR